MACSYKYIYIAYAEFEDIEKSVYSYKVNSFIGLQGIKDRQPLAYKRLASDTDAYRFADAI
ncbi:hypothetical protein [Butyrivibrio sp. WCE2006]|uniref:hypothetical protein n=1 Tax=Butyrivibrio sp. WCE2006 TaxID=1410611 RepID=UPI0005D1C67C|nr:hypothetical protein [Butyrivibrio sp. WCE2006]